MKVKYMSSGGETKDITSLCSSIRWSGDMHQAARKLELQIISPAFDGSIPRVEAKPGEKIILLDDDGQEIFQGYVFTREKSLSQQSLNIQCYDGLIYLTKSKASYNFSRMSAEEITGKVCGEIGVLKGKLADTGISQSLIIMDKSPYEIITAAYENAGVHTGKKYVVLFRKGRLDVLEKGEDEVSCVLDHRTNISNSQYGESIENMINRVMVYDENGNMKTKVDSQEWVKSFGVLQSSYKKEAGKDANTVAKSMLKGLERKGKLEAIGNTKCVTGSAIKIKEPHSGLEGIFYISSDTHTWQDGKHTMDLTLDFEKMK